MNLEEMSIEDLQHIRDSAEAEMGARLAGEYAVQTISDAIASYHAARPDTAPQPGGVWGAPATVLEAYPQGISAVNGGTLYENTVPNNLREPGTPGCGWLNMGPAGAEQPTDDARGQDD